MNEFEELANVFIVGVKKDNDECVVKITEAGVLIDDEHSDVDLIFKTESQDNKPIVVKKSLFRNKRKQKRYLKMERKIVKKL